MGGIAFYAPLKSPNHAVPSGDRAMARALVQALSSSGATVDLVSELRSLDRIGDTGIQSTLKANAESEIRRLLDLAPQRNWQVWVTYHNYYKAPDLIGPAVSAALGIPYVQIESTRAHKRLTGPWAGFARTSEAACNHASVIFHMTENDRITLIKHKIQGQDIVHLPPFLALDRLPDQPAKTRDKATLLCAGMMREGDKLASYRIMAQTLAQLKTKDWALHIAGDGPARVQVQALFDPFGDQVTFLGQQGASALADSYNSATLFLWPGVNEAYGMVYLEAQATGLPVIAQDRPGVRDVVHGGVLAQPDNTTALAHTLDELLADPVKCRKLGKVGRNMIEKHHLIPAARQILMTHISPLAGAPQ